MLIIQYEKTGSTAYLSHLDVLRLFGRVVRRSGLKVGFSEGFHPHMLLWFGNPMSLGISSNCEYCTAESDETPEDFVRRFNEKTVSGLAVLAAARTAKNPNFADILVAAEYRIRCSGVEEAREQLLALILAPDFEVEYPGGKSKPAADKVLAVEVSQGELTVTLKAGRENLKADAFMETVCRRLSLGAFDIVRTRQFFEREGALVDANQLFQSENV